MCMWDSLDKLKSQLQNVLNKLTAMLLTVQYCGKVGLLSSFISHIIRSKLQKPCHTRWEKNAPASKTKLLALTRTLLCFITWIFRMKYRPYYLTYPGHFKMASFSVVSWGIKALANDDTLLRTHCCSWCFLGCANWETFVADTKCFWTKSETFFVSRKQNLCPQQMLPTGANGETFVSATMCPRLPGPLVTPTNLKSNHTTYQSQALKSTPQMERVGFL